ncbi:MAG: aspartate/glutamate racemase family protein [Desulfobacterales bacterium]
MREKVVGIIGGMGPEATVDFMNRVIKATPAMDDCDHIRMLVDNNPKVPSRIAAILEGTGESPVPCLQAMARRLASWGADFLAMPCNTAHYYHPDIQKAVAIPLLDMIDLAVQAILHRNPGIARIGLLASAAVIRLQLYERRFAGDNVDMLKPADTLQARMMEAIKKIKTSRYGREVVAAMQAGADDLTGRGAEAILVACTEISIVGGEIRTSVDLYDSAQILAEAVVKEARQAD